MKYKLEHACIRVMNLEKSLEFYKKALSLEEVKRLDYPEYKFTLVYLSDENRNFEIELTYNYDTKKKYEMGDGFSHFALTVKDLESSHLFHKNMGLELTNLKGLANEEPRYYFITDPDGYNIEIIRE
uniref:Lactoylglutathione lyase n=1 Tax=Hirondellea gigas TaxID=1518452 RepID=A0A6A7G3J6_9CRUS